MHSCITGCIIDIHIPIFSCNGSVGEDYIGYISDSLIAQRYQEHAGRLCNDPGRIFQIRSEGIEHIAETGCCISYAVCNMDPAFLTFKRNSSGSVFGLRQGMINPAADDFFLIDDCMLDIITEAKTDPSAASCLDEAIHGTGIKCIFTIDKFRMEHHISLLRRT